MSVPTLIRPVTLALLLLSIACFQSCHSDSPSKESPPSDEQSVTYPSVPDSVMQRLWDECDYIDFVFYNLSFSMSQQEQHDIRATLQHISRQPADINENCQPMGRLFFQIEGENVAQADIFFSPECQYFLFYQNNEKAYANTMTPAGIQFYERVLSMSEGR